MVGKGKIVWVSGPAVRADGMSSTKMYETIEVGESKLIGEVHQINRRYCIYPSLRIYIRS